MDQFLCKSISIGGFGLPKFEIGGRECYFRKNYQLALSQKGERYYLVVQNYCMCRFANTFLDSKIEELSLRTELNQEEKELYFYHNTFGKYMAEFPEHRETGFLQLSGYFLDHDFYFIFNQNLLEINYISNANLNFVLSEMLSHYSKEERQRIIVELIMNLNSDSKIKA